MKKRPKNLYLICADDYLETAFFCGTVDECAAVLQVRKDVFYTKLSKKQRIRSFFRIEKVSLKEESKCQTG